MRKPLLKHAQIIRLGRILDMMYKPPELAEEIGVTSDTIYRSYIPAGLPYIREYHSLWIHGPSFVQWARGIITTQRKAHPGLPDAPAHDPTGRRQRQPFDKDARRRRHPPSSADAPQARW